MENTASTQNPLERSLELFIDRAELERATDERIKRMGRNAKVHGFRPGKAPLSVLRQQYGEGARHETLSEALRNAFHEAVTAQKLNVVGFPRIEEKAEANSEARLAYSAVFEVYPEFTLGDLSGAKVERPVLEVGVAEVDRAIEIFRKQRVRYAPAERPAAKEDRVVIDFLGKKNGEPFQGGQASEYPFVLGQGMMLPAFENAVEGMKAGEEKTFEMTFPEDYFAKDFAGQPVSFEVKVRQVMAPSLPDVDADFARALGVADGDLTKMRTEIEGNLKREVKKRLEARVQTQVMDALLAANPISVPNVLIEQEVERMMQSAKQDLAARGMKDKDFPVQPAWFAGQARRRVALGLIFAEIVKQEKINANKEQIRALVEEAAQTYEKPQEVVQWYYADPHRLADVEALAVEKNVVDWVLARVTVTEQPIAFDTLMTPPVD
ncbi:MAG: trigger factor [Zoogloeaceae bacterium]|jgi:trigger factor|nr:trigger factor [Zoogloeaceae bacterium]